MRKSLFTLVVFASLCSSQNSFSQSVLLDNTFDVDGIVTTDIGNFEDMGYSMALQSDGKIVVGGHTDNGSSIDFAIARYNSDGSLDPTFGTAGIVTTSITNYEDRCYALTIQSDGKILATGHGFDGTFENIVIVRYNTNGTLDYSFDADGIVVTNVNLAEFATSIILQADQKILICGSTNDGFNSFYFIARYNLDGSLDNSFDLDGIVTNDIDMYTLNSIVLQSDGKIVGTGNIDNSGNMEFGLVRYNSDGTLDNSFNTNGIVQTDLGSNFDYPFTVKIQPDGKIIAAGITYNGTDQDFALARYNSDGSLDLSFDTDGITTTDLQGYNDDPYDFIFQSDGKIIVGGYSFNSSQVDFGIVRYNSNGTPDNSYDFDGIVITDFAFDEHIESMAFQTDGKLVVAGNTTNGPGGDFVVARYLPAQLGLSNSSELDFVDLYPNPTTGNLTLTSTTEIQNASLKITDISGKIIYYKENLSGINFQIDLSNQPAGIYFLELSDEGTTQQIRVVKN